MTLLIALAATLATQAAAPAPPSAPAAPAATQAAPAPAAPAPTAPPPAFMAAAQAFGQCIGTGASALARTVTPEAGARQVTTGCAAQKQALDAQFETWISGPTFPAAGRDMARQQFKAQMDGMEPNLAERIRSARAGAASATPQPTPTPTATPTPRK